MTEVELLRILLIHRLRRVGIRLEGPTSERIERLFKEEMKVSYMYSLRKISMEVKKGNIW
jgi:hypothetical protein